MFHPQRALGWKTGASLVPFRSLSDLKQKQTKESNWGFCWIDKSTFIFLQDTGPMSSNSARRIILPDCGIPYSLPDRYSLLHATAKPPPQLSTTDFTQRTKILQSKLFCISISLGVLWATGGLIRLQSPLSPQVLLQLAGMILFHPASMIVIWLGWKTGLRLADVLSACLIATLSFGIWNAIMLPGLPWDLVGRTLISNAIHWALFLGVGIAIARYLQWGTSIGIWSENRKARGAPNVRHHRRLPRFISLADYDCDP